MGKNTKANAAALEAERKEKRNSIIITVCVIVAAVLVIGLAAYNSLRQTGIFLRTQTVAETENFEVDAAMMAYMYSANYMSYYSYFPMMGVDTSVSLKQQDCTFAGEGTTWFDYLMTATKSQLNEVLALCEAAHAAGMTLTDKEYDAIDANIANIEAEAKNYGYSNIDAYLLASTGNPIKLKDLRNCLELTSLAGKYSSEYLAEIEYTAEDLEAFSNENYDAMMGVDIYSYNFLASEYQIVDDEGNMNDAAEQSKLAKEAADKLAAATNVKAFTDAVKENIDAVATKNEGESDEAFEKRKEGILEDALTEHALKSNLKTAIGEWAFSDDAKVGDTYVEGEEGDTKFTVYMLVKEAYRDETPSRDIRHILFHVDNYEDDTKAQEIYAELTAAGGTEEEFIRLAKEYSDDGSAENGGLIENVLEGQMVASFNDWLFDESRKVGDIDLIESEYGWHIMYYCGEGELSAWEITAENGLLDAEYTSIVEKYSADIKYNDRALNAIDA